MTNRTLVVLDAANKVLASAPARSTAQRISARGAADQKQIDSMYVPGAVRAEIRFDTGAVLSLQFVNGKSQFRI